MNVNVAPDLLVPIVKKLTPAPHHLAQITVFVWIYLKDMKETPTNVCVPMVSSPFFILLLLQCCRRQSFSCNITHS